MIARPPQRRVNRLREAETLLYRGQFYLLTVPDKVWNLLLSLQLLFSCFSSPEGTN